MDQKAKTYSQMTPAERLADRIAKNRAIDAKVAPVINMQNTGKRLIASHNARRAAQNLDQELRRLEDGKGGLPEFLLLSFDEVVNCNRADFQKAILTLIDRS